MADAMPTTADKMPVLRNTLRLAAENTFTEGEREHVARSGRHVAGLLLGSI